ncbi:MAG TPA: MFS transporter [Acidimicrobiia bacterium]|nr:MFS transporter [Acidimicrobiia bacterium]
MTGRSRGLRHAFRALRHRDFALFWSGALVSSTGMWMQAVTVPFLLHEATGSAAWVGLGAFAQFAPAMVASPLGGSLADRYARRTILFWNQAALLVLALALWLSVRGGTIRPGLIVALIGLTGVVAGLGIPSWQSFVAELVPRESLLNAVALNSAQFNVSRAVGFMLGGLALYAVGPGLSFFVNAVSYLAVLGALAAIRPRPAPGVAAVATVGPPEVVPPPTAGPATFRLGLAYVREHPGLQLAVFTCGVVMFLGGPVIQLAPVFARDTFGVDERAYGFLAAALGIGAVTGSLVLGAYGDAVRRSKLLVASVVFYGLGVLGMAVTPTYAGGLAAMASIGLAYLAVASVLITSIQLAVDDRFRGRVLALYVMVFTGAYPLGSLLQGIATDHFGVRRVVGVAGAALLGYAAVLAARPAAVAALDLSFSAGGPSPTGSPSPAGRPGTPSRRSG